MDDDRPIENLRVARLRAELDRSGVDCDPSLEYHTADAGARLLAITLAQRECVDPLPAELVDVLISFDDLMHFVDVRLAQERPSHSEVMNR